MRRHQTLLIAHRGASAEAPESTRAAIRRAVALGVEAIELDVQLTQDRRLVIFHDKRLDRTTNGRGVLARSRYAELARLDCGSWFAPRFSGERIPLMSQVLQLVPPTCLLNLELKRTTQKDRLIRQVVRCLQWTGSIRRVLVSSFDGSLLGRLKRAQPRIARAFLCARQPFQAVRVACALGCVAIHPQASLITAEVVERAHARGLRVHVWTVDRIDEARRLLCLGVDGPFTNVPARMLMLRRRPR